MKTQTIRNIKAEEDSFPKHITNYIEKPYGTLFYNEQNRESWDSNHAIIYKDKVDNLKSVIDEISEFYLSKGITPTIYQSVMDQGYFDSNRDIFEKCGLSFDKDMDRKMMVLSDDSIITNNQNSQLRIKIVESWDERIATDICIPSGESHEIEVIKSCIESNIHEVLVIYDNEKAVGITYLHRSENFDCTRFDYIIVSKDYRKQGVARELLSLVVNFCRENGYQNCFLWPAHQSSERICYEAGFREIFRFDIVRAFKKGG